MWKAHKFMWAAAIAPALVGCGSAPAEPTGPRFSEAALADARAALKAESKIVDFVLAPDRAIELNAAVYDNGSRRYGYASYLCDLLAVKGAADDRTDVRIVDAAKVGASNGNWRSISLGTVRCKDYSRLD